MFYKTIAIGAFFFVLFEQRVKAPICIICNFVYNKEKCVQKYASHRKRGRKTSNCSYSVETARKYVIKKKREDITMAFGDNARKAKEASGIRNGASTTSTPTYFPFDIGNNLFRLFPNEDVIMYREFWMTVPVLMTDSQQKQRYEQKERRAILSVFDPNDMGYRTAEGKKQDPVTEWFYSLSEEERKAADKKIRTRFAVNVLNRNLFLKLEDGTLARHDEGEPLDIVQVLSHSAGKEGGTHTYQELIDCTKNIRNIKGKKIEPHESDINIRRTGEGKFSTRYSVSIGFNQEEVDFSQFQKYDLESFYKPFPFEALTAMQQGRTGLGYYSENIRYSFLS
jgi:hypothetical protein